MRRSPDVSPRRLSDISPQLRQLKYLVVDEAIKEDLKWSRSVEDLTSASVGLTSIEERILRITGYYGYQPWAASYKRESQLGAARVCVCGGGGLSLRPQPSGRGWGAGVPAATSYAAETEGRVLVAALQGVVLCVCGSPSAFIRTRFSKVMF